MKLLEQVLNRFHLNATIFHRARMCNTWSTDTSGSGLASFHFISSGKAYLHAHELKGIELVAGDMVIFPHDAQHVIADTPETELGAPFISHPIEKSIDNSTGLVCGFFDFAEDAAHPLLMQLPSCIVLKAKDTNGLTSHLIQALVAEAESGLDSSSILLSRLSEAFFIAVLRGLAKLDNQTGYFKALQDVKMSRVLETIQQNIADNWTTQSLADTGGYSRASFAKYFKEYFGTSVMDYLTQLRLSEAQKRLRKGDSVFEVALDVGYQSDASFAKAYKRHFGYGPGESRKAKVK
ncbi:AraC family transcriptional regulator [Shewanella sp. 202IG2-18]|uniref:AraC family transcriptional regulator n=1 Tax=Parashewanella hymeniacidonis TaxID=2807618 RepID=UPI00196098A6|nr:AraC family transcriptional regulator [Parashewanella hymeniacidonis]MBM7070655.1 AraC family transcriptional regulator [Parashewanella hymeniacidonis]